MMPILKEPEIKYLTCENLSWSNGDKLIERLIKIRDNNKNRYTNNNEAENFLYYIEGSNKLYSFKNIASIVKDLDLPKDVFIDCLSNNYTKLAQALELYFIDSIIKSVKNYMS